jgi:hypothetical protein
MATPSQLTAYEIATNTPAAASHSIGVAVGRKPTSSPTPSTSATAMIAWIVLPSTCPASTAALEIAMVRNRAVMPSVMSIETVIAAPVAAPVMVIMRMPGMTYARYASRPPAGSTPGRPAPRVPPNTNTVSSSATTGPRIVNADRPG